MYSPIFTWCYHYYIVFTNIRVILPLLHCFHQYSCDTTIITLYSPISVWYYHYYIVFNNIHVMLPLLHYVIVMYLSSSPVFIEVRTTWSLVLYLCFVGRSLYFCTFSVGHFVVCYSWIYWLWLLLWYLQRPLYSICN